MANISRAQWSPLRGGSVYRRNLNLNRLLSTGSNR